MKFSQTHRPSARPTKLAHPFQQTLLTFIHKQVQVFEALARSGNPFGSNWLPADQQPGQPQPSVFGSAVSPRTVSSRSGSKATQTKGIGLDRFRAQQENA
ncbi:hypothetical protein GGR92_004290 [Spirosoma lacussanchae]|uniref:hypothetical protein n=1 Tax=Spirosoma lacussanchae TaxID=1884249 RepID=UPI0011083716|nr:hypothetical protein [Spirosoma lacussanchae]